VLYLRLPHPLLWVMEPRTGSDATNGLIAYPSRALLLTCSRQSTRRLSGFTKSRRGCRGVSWVSSHTLMVHGYTSTTDGCTLAVGGGILTVDDGTITSIGGDGKRRLGSVIASTTRSCHHYVKQHLPIC
jgi:hypothetical protein